MFIRVYLWLFILRVDSIDAFAHLESHSMKSVFAILSIIIASAGTAIAADDAQALAPTFADVAYGPHERNVLDFWKADGDGPRPLLVYIHGGGWIGGDKKQKPEAIRPWLEKGISYAAVNYRLTGQAPLLAGS